MELVIGTLILGRNVMRFWVRFSIVLLGFVCFPIGVANADIVHADVNVLIGRTIPPHVSSYSLNFSSAHPDAVPADFPLVFSVVPNIGDPTDFGTGIRVSSSGTTRYAFFGSSINLPVEMILGSSTPGVTWMTGATTLHHLAGPNTFAVGAVGYIGVEYQNSGNTHYGWVSYEALENSSHSRGIVRRWAVDVRPDMPITVGSLVAIPEPSSLIVLSLSTFGFLIRRRR